MSKEIGIYHEIALLLCIRFALSFKSLFIQKQRDTTDVLSRMKKTEGPLGKLHEWVLTRRRVRIVLRGRSSPNAVVTAVVVAFDKHWNIIFR